MLDPLSRWLENDETIPFTRPIHSEQADPAPYPMMEDEVQIGLTLDISQFLYLYSIAAT